MNIRLCALLLACLAASAAAVRISDTNFVVEIGTHGEISSLKIVGDAFPTDYVMNAANSPDQNTTDHQWMGELLFKFRKAGSEDWDSASTNASAGTRTVVRNGATKATVRYASGTAAGSIRGFTVEETYELKEGALVWSVTVANPSGDSLEFGDLGLPMPFNERWPENAEIYETQTVKHSFVGHNGSYITAKRPSGIGSFVLFTPDARTGAALEYMDNWREETHRGSKWAADNGNWPAGLNVYYVHSEAVKEGGRGYLPSTSLRLGPGASRTYAFKFHKVADEAEVQARLYAEGMVAVSVAPGMIVPLGDVARVDLHTSKAIGSIAFQHPGESSGRFVSKVAGDHNVHEFTFSRLGENIVTVDYGAGEKIALQFYVIERPGDAVQRHATFMVEKTQVSNPGAFNDKVFDDWILDTRARRNAFTGYQGFTHWMGWGDDWGHTHAQFLAEKNVMMPVASEIGALDDYLETAVWGSLMKANHTDFRVHNWLSTPGFTDDYVRGYAYPHVYNTFFGMYRIAKLHGDIATFRHPALTYLKRAYGVMNSLYAYPNSYNFDTGLMGELTTPDILAALEAEGLTAEAAKIRGYMATKYGNFKGKTYPYGSEYNYDNTGEEAVYTLARMNGNTAIQGKIQDKTRACRGWQPTWYFYGVPVTICGENWWNFQYTASLAGAAMDDWMRTRSLTPDLDARGTYAAKLANFTAVNSGQIDPDPANLGAVAWTYQAMKGKAKAQGTADVGYAQHNGWRGMSGEADLGLFGALRIISADVADDPVFGLIGYGCDVVRTGADYEVAVKDGIGQRVNLIPLRVWIALDQDRIATVSVNDAKDRIEASLAVRKPVAHVARLTVDGLASGEYTVYVDGAAKGTFTASGTSVKIPVSLSGASAARLLVQRSSAPVSIAAVRPRVGLRRDGEGWRVSCSASEGCPRIRVLGADGSVRSEITLEGSDPSRGIRFPLPAGGLSLVQALWPEGAATLVGKVMGLP